MPLGSTLSLVHNDTGVPLRPKPLRFSQRNASRVIYILTVYAFYFLLCQSMGRANPSVQVYNGIVGDIDVMPAGDNLTELGSGARQTESLENILRLSVLGTEIGCAVIPYDLCQSSLEPVEYIPVALIERNREGHQIVQVETVAAVGDDVGWRYAVVGQIQPIMIFALLRLKEQVLDALHVNAVKVKGHGVQVPGVLLGVGLANIRDRRHDCKLAPSKPIHSIFAVTPNQTLAVVSTLENDVVLVVVDNLVHLLFAVVACFLPCNVKHDGVVPPAGIAGVVDLYLPLVALLLRQLVVGILDLWKPHVFVLLAHDFLKGDNAVSKFIVTLKQHREEIIDVELANPEAGHGGVSEKRILLMEELDGSILLLLLLFTQLVIASHGLV